MGRSIYLAGPEVFLPDAIAIGESKRAICALYGLRGRFPLDNVVEPKAGQSLAAAIFAANMQMLAECDLIVANLTPFRGISADVGTVFELGAAYAMGKPVFGYSNTGGTLLERLSALSAFLPIKEGADGRPYASDGLAVEDFGLADNLMLTEALQATAHALTLPEQPVADTARDLATFEACLRAVVRAEADGPPPGRD